MHYDHGKMVKISGGSNIESLCQTLDQSTGKIWDVIRSYKKNHILSGLPETLENKDIRRFNEI